MVICNNTYIRNITEIAQQYFISITNFNSVVASRIYLFYIILKTCFYYCNIKTSIN